MCSFENGYAIPDGFVDFNLQQYDSLFENKFNTDEPDTLLNMPFRRLES